MVPYFSVAFEKSNTSLSFSSINGEHFVGKPRVTILFSTASIGFMSS